MNTYDFFGLFVIFAMILAFFLFYILENFITSIYQLSHTLPTFVSTVTQTYLCVFFCTVGLVYIIDPIFTLVWQLFFNNRLDKHIHNKFEEDDEPRDCYTKLADHMHLKK
jgi:hypothetical protein